jgi:hypothetical protein
VVAVSIAPRRLVLARSGRLEGVGWGDADCRMCVKREVSRVILTPMVLVRSQRNGISTLSMLLRLPLAALAGWGRRARSPYARIGKGRAWISGLGLGLDRSWGR